MALTAAQAALDAGDWRQAAAEARAAITTDDSADAHLALALALWCGYEIDRSIAAMKAAYQRFLAESRPERAGFIAGWIALEELATRGNPAVARGWIQRGARIFAEAPSCSEYGWFLLWRTAVEGTAADLAAAAAKTMAIARACGDRDLEIECLAVQGLTSVQLGSVNEGMALLDEAMAAVTGGETSSPLVVGDCFCFVLGACQQAADYTRAEQWCRVGLEAVESRPNGFMKASCLTAYGCVLAVTGRWVESETRLREAIGLYKSGHKRLQPDASIKLAELRRRQDRLPEARRFLDGLDGSIAALSTLTEIAIDEKDYATACDLARRLRAMAEQGLVTEQVVALQLMVRAAAGHGDIDEARDAMEELGVKAAGVTTDYATAATWNARGALARACGETEAAMRAYEQAAALFAHACAPLEAAQAELARAELLRAVGRTVDAEALAHRATHQIRRLRHGDSGSGLTQREQEVLRLLAQGLSNAAVADQLGLSTHTVHRHVANVLQKLDAPTRAAAVAEASQRGLV